MTAKKFREYFEYRKKDSKCSPACCEQCHHGIFAWGKGRNPYARPRAIIYCYLLMCKQPIRVDRNHVCKAYEPVHIVDPLPEDWIIG